MIDTIRLKIKYKVTDCEKFNEIAFSKHGLLQFKVFKDTINVGSFSYDINLYINQLDTLMVEFSLPKYIYGNNINTASFDDIYKVFQELFERLSSFGECSPIEDWQITRLDLCKYIKSLNPYKDIFLYQTLNYPRQKKYIYDTSVMFVGNSFSTKFYIKEDEFLRHDFKKISKTNINFAHELLESSKGLIRMETGYRSKALKNILKVEKVTLDVIIKNQSKLINHFSSLKKKLNLCFDSEKMKQLSLLDELKKIYKPARAFQLYQFYCMYFSDDMNRKIVKDNYSRSQVYRNLKLIYNIFN